MANFSLPIDGVEGKGVEAIFCFRSYSAPPAMLSMNLEAGRVRPGEPAKRISQLLFARLSEDASLQSE